MVSTIFPNERLREDTQIMLTAQLAIAAKDDVDRDLQEAMAGISLEDQDRARWLAKRKIKTQPGMTTDSVQAPNQSGGQVSSRRTGQGAV